MYVYIYIYMSGERRREREREGERENGLGLQDVQESVSQLVCGLPLGDFGAYRGVGFSLG